MNNYLFPYHKFQDEFEIGPKHTHNVRQWRTKSKQLFPISTMKMDYYDFVSLLYKLTGRETKLIKWIMKFGHVYNVPYTSDVVVEGLRFTFDVFYKELGLSRKVFYAVLGNLVKKNVLRRNYTMYNDKKILNKFYYINPDFLFFANYQSINVAVTPCNYTNLEETTVSENIQDEICISELNPDGELKNV